MVPADLNKIASALPRPALESQIVAVALKRRLSDTQIVQKQYIRPDKVNTALATLKHINPYYAIVKTNSSWLGKIEQDHPDLLIDSDSVNGGKQMKAME